MKIRRLAIANRGEIACRVIRTCRRLGIHAIALHSEADANALHVRLADEALPIGPAPARQSYLDIDAVIGAARAARADAIHPGYGFLSENAAFAQACERAGLTFVGPPAAAIRAMGLKHEAKALVAAAGVPVVPGYAGEDQSPARLAREAAKIGYPLLVKAVAGGGGKGMRVVTEAGQLEEAIRGARGEAESAFGDGRLLLERFLTRPRHVEVQVFADAHGRCVHLFERECSVQRRYQKILEESPSPVVDPRLREAMTQAAVRAAQAVGYVNAGTVEFIAEPGGGFWFMEMNTRLQVEHPVTEMVTGLDLVEWQLRVAAGEALPLAQEEIRLQGHAIEARLYSEDPRRGFLPSVGRIEGLVHPPEAAGWRVDAGVAEGDAVTVHYDPMIAKLVAHGPDRGSALAKLREGLERTAVFGVATNLPLLRAIVAHPEFVAGGVDTGFVDRELAELTRERALPDEALLAAADLALAGRTPTAPARATPWAQGDGWRSLGGTGQAIGLRTPSFLRLRACRHGEAIEVECDGRKVAGRVRPTGDARLEVELGSGAHEVRWLRHGDTLQLVVAGAAYDVALAPAWPYERGSEDADAHPSSPLPGRVVEVRVTEGARVARGDVLAVVEGMKMQHAVRAGRAGRVLAVLAREGQQVDAEAVLFDIAPE